MNTSEYQKKSLYSLLVCFWLPVILIVSLFIPRLTYLDYSPPGFFVDEAAAAAHLLCLRDTGANCNGESFTMYSRTFGNGRIGPVYQYLGWFWVEFIGSTIFDLRFLSALFGSLTILAMFYFCRKISSPKLAFWAGLSGLIMPWSFQGSRLSWDPPLAPVFAFASVMLFLLINKSNRPFLTILSSSILCTLAAMVYPPVLMHLFFLFALLFVFQIWIVKISFKYWLYLLACTGALLAPLKLSDTSTVSGRVAEVSIFGEHENNPTRGQPISARLVQFGDNILQHFNPDYIFKNGEYNLRHCVDRFGIFSWLDIFAVSSGLLLWILARFAKTLRAEDVQHLRAPLLVGFLGYLSACMAASLTWDSIPHGLRSFSGWPFAALFFGTCLQYVSRSVVLRLSAIIITVIFSINFFTYYFGRYRISSAWWYDTDVTSKLEASLKKNSKEDLKKFLEQRHYPSIAAEYFYRQYFPEKSTSEN